MAIQLQRHEDKQESLCIRYFSKTKSKPAKKITEQCCSTEMEFACENSANLEQETKTTKIVTYPLFSAECTIGMVWGLTALRHYDTMALWH